MTPQTGRVEVEWRTDRVIIATTVLGSAVAMLTATVVPSIARGTAVLVGSGGLGSALGLRCSDLAEDSS